MQRHERGKKLLHSVLVQVSCRMPGDHDRGRLLPAFRPTRCQLPPGCPFLHRGNPQGHGLSSAGLGALALGPRRRRPLPTGRGPARAPPATAPGWAPRRIAAGRRRQRCLTRSRRRPCEASLAARAAPGPPRRLCGEWGVGGEGVSAASPGATFGGQTPSPSAQLARLWFSGRPRGGEPVTSRRAFRSRGRGREGGSGRPRGSGSRGRRGSRTFPWPRRRGPAAGGS